ncbi:MAG TPA: flagellar hook-length control protein FliK [Geomonas sp.]|nr:flagellar hook-length control protein FliK [Geomonas sp.]
MFINDEAQRQVLPIIVRTTTNPASSDTQQRAGALLQLNAGQQVKAEIIARLPNNLYLARVAGQMYRLEIPLNVQPGETMDMTFLTAEPRITFQLMPQAQGGASVRLSSIGKWLATVTSDGIALPAHLEPLLDSPIREPLLSANRLKESLVRSGLFYESHLAQWAAGNVHLEELLQEPQGKLSRLVAGKRGSAGAEERLDAGFADSRTLPFIKEQLLLVSTRVLSWKGEAWPGQGMEISISGGEDEEAGMEASLSLQFSNLGGVEAKLSIGREGLSLQLVCDRPGSSGYLKEGGAGLRMALASAGINLTRLAAKDGEEDD